MRSRKTLIPTLILISTLACAACASDYVPPDAEKTLDTIKLKLSTSLRSWGKKPETMLTLFGALQTVSIESADNQHLTVVFREKQFEQAWDRIPAKEVASAANAVLGADTQGAMLVIDFCLAKGLTEASRDYIEKLGKSSAGASVKQALDDRLAYLKARENPAGPAPAKAPVAAMSIAASGEPPSASSGSSGSSASIAAPAKLAFFPSQSGALRPIKEVAAALDNAIEIDLAEMGIKPEAVCDDASFLRRASLDLTGQIPTPEDAIAFFNDANPAKREKRIEELLHKPEYADHWATFWEVLLVGRHTRDNAEVNTGQLKIWLRDEFTKNEPYDKMVTELLTASGENDKNGPVNYLTDHLADTLPNTVAHMSQTFLGARIGCAQCHDHPFDKWTQEDFWAFSSFLANTRSDRKELREDPKDPKKVTRAWHVLTDQEKRNGDPRYSPPRGELNLPPKALDGPVFKPGAAPAPAPAPAPKAAELKKPDLAEPKAGAAAKPGMMDKGDVGGAGIMMGGGGGMGMMGGMEAAAAGVESGKMGLAYRRALAAWITSTQNEKFAQSVVNRLWRQMFGYGLVEPVDDIRPKNPPSHPDVINILAQDFNASGRDLKRLMAIITNTKAYQRSANGAATKVDRQKAVRMAGRAEVRPMTPEMLFTAVIKACGGEEKARTLMDGLRKRDQATMEKKNEAVDQTVNDFYNLEQRFINTSTAEDRAGKLQFEGTVSQALMMMHSDFINHAIKDGVQRFKKKNMGDMIYIFAALLGRPPTSQESAAFQIYGADLETCMWILINSAEFVTIH